MNLLFDSSRSQPLWSSREFSFARYITSLCVLVAAMTSMSVLVGCEEEEVVSRRREPKPPKVEAADRMLAAIVPAKGRGWFLKLSGSKESVAKELPRFEALLDSLTIDGEKLNWTVPSGWSEKRGNEMRAATLVTEQPKVECAISFLATDDPTTDEYLIANINRWRGQIGLGNIAAGDLPKEPRADGELRLMKLKDGTRVTWVSLEGNMAAGGGPMAPFANRPQPQEPARSEGPRREVGPSGPPSANESPRSNDNEDFAFAQPAHWKPGKQNAFSRAAFEVVEGDKKIDITVSPLSKTGLGLLPNINRWRGQIMLEPTDDEGLKKLLVPQKVGTHEGQFIELQNGTKAILGVVVEVGDQRWYFKLSGDRDIAMKEKDAFRTFAATVTFKK